MNVAVLGGTGMLGSMVVDFLSRQKDVEVVATARPSAPADTLHGGRNGVAWKPLDAETCDAAEIGGILSGSPWAVNAIGVIKPFIHDDNAAEVERATRVNALFPHVLARAAEKAGCRVLQIATDCVYSGAKGGYREPDRHDALDVYGKTKSLGEVRSPNVFHLRVSIVGPEPKGHVSLLDWFRGQEPGATVNGFTNHRWNGVTTLHFAKLCNGIVAHGVKLGHLQHVVPGDAVTKNELLGLFAADYGRSDVTIRPTPAPEAIDRTLDTSAPDANRRLWEAAGYAQPPTIAEMVTELASFPQSEGIR